MNSARRNVAEGPPSTGVLREKVGRLLNRASKMRKMTGAEKAPVIEAVHAEMENLYASVKHSVVEKTTKQVNRTSLGVPEQGEIMDSGEDIPRDINGAFAFFEAKTGIRLDHRFEWGGELLQYMREDFTTSFGKFILYLAEQREIRNALLVSDNKSVDVADDEVVALLLGSSPNNPLPIRIRWADFPDDDWKDRPIPELTSDESLKLVEASKAQASDILSRKKPKTGNVTFPANLQRDLPLLYWLILDACQKTGTPFSVSEHSLGSIKGRELFELGVSQEELARRTAEYNRGSNVVASGSFAMDLLQMAESFTDLPTFGSLQTGQLGFDGYQLTTTTMVRMFLETRPEYIETNSRRRISTGRNMNSLVGVLLAKGRSAAPLQSLAVEELVNGLHYLMRTYFRRRLAGYTVGTLKSTDVLLTRLIQKDAPNAIELLKEELKPRPARSAVAAKDPATGRVRTDANKKPVMVRPDTHQLPFVPPTRDYLGEIELRLVRSMNTVYEKHSSRGPRRDVLYSTPSESRGRNLITGIASGIDRILDLAYEVINGRRNAVRSAAMGEARRRRSELPESHRDKRGVGFLSEDYLVALGQVKEDTLRWGAPLDIRLQGLILGRENINLRLTVDQIDRFEALGVNPECPWFNLQHAFRVMLEEAVVDLD